MSAEWTKSDGAQITVMAGNTAIQVVRISAHEVVINDLRGAAVLTIDLDRRRIEAGPGVAVEPAAAAVLAAVQRLLKLRAF